MLRTSLHRVLAVPSVLSVLAVTAVVAGAPAAAATGTTVVSTSFETPLVSSSWNTYGGGAVIDGWTVGTGTVDLVSDRYWQAHSGHQSVDLSGNSPGSLTRVLPTTLGATYALDFWLSGNGGCAYQTKKMSVTANGSDLFGGPVTFDTSGTSYSNMGWQQHSAQFVANGNTVTLAFTSLTPSCGGPVLDDVSLTETAAPPTGPTGHLDTVVTSAGAPLADAHVSAGTTVNGTRLTYLASTGADGVAHLDVPAGPVDVSATKSGYLDSAESVTVTDGGTSTATLDLLRQPAYVVHPHLYTREAGGAEVEQPMDDWSMRYHYHLRVQGGGLSLTSTAVQPAMPAPGSPGDTVEFCADGREAGLTSGCATAVLGTSDDVEVAVHLTQAGRASATVLAPDGQPVSSWAASVYRASADGSLQLVTSRSGWGSDGVVGFPDSGDYQVVFTSGSYRSATIPVAIGTDTVVDLGSVQLLSPGQVGVDGLQVTPDPALPGALVEFRAALTNTSGSAWTTAALEASLPTGVTFEPAGTTVDGAPVTAATGVGAVTIPLGTVPAGAHTVVRWAATIATDAPAGLLGAVLTLHHDGATTPLGTATTQVAGVTIAGPHTVPTATFNLSGEAPPGATVTLEDYGQPVGSATAGAGGRWLGQATLYKPVRTSTHQLTAVTTLDGVTLRSQPLEVVYDDSSVQATSVTVSQPGASSFTFDPRDGVAAFTMVYRPSLPMQVVARFPADAADRVHDVVAVVGDGYAPATCSAGECTATVPVTAQTVGPVYLTYAVDALPTTTSADMPDVSPDAWRHNLPAPWNGFTATGHTVAADGTETITATNLATGDRLVATFQDGPVSTYTPTSADLALARGSGVPFYDLTTAVTGDATSTTVTAQTLVPTAWLPTPDTVTAAGTTTTAAALTLHPAALHLSPTVATPMGFVSTSVQALRYTFTFLGGAQAGARAANNGPYDDLLALEDLVRQSTCDPQAKAGMLDEIDSASKHVLAYTMVGNAIGGVFTLFGGELFTGLRAVSALGAKTVVGTGLNWASNWVVKDEVQRTATFVQQMVKSCADWTDWLKRYGLTKEIANPTYLYDPSGIVYEGVESNPLAGVTATLYTAPSPDGPWTVWDAAAYGQTNPQTTGADGAYGWEVPKGWWQVRWTKDGYADAVSAPMQVLPERTGVNADLLRLAPPGLGTVTATRDDVTVSFDTYMQASSVQAAVVVQVAPDEGHAVARTVRGVWAPVDPQAGPDGTVLATSFVFHPRGRFPVQAAVTVTVGPSVTDYAGVAAGTSTTRTVHLHAHPAGIVIDGIGDMPGCVSPGTASGAASSSTPSASSAATAV